MFLIAMDVKTKSKTALTEKEAGPHRPPPHTPFKFSVFLILRFLMAEAQKALMKICQTL
jgi:hypothetical protein